MLLHFLMFLITVLLQFLMFLITVLLQFLMFLITVLLQFLMFLITVHSGSFWRGKTKAGDALSTLVMDAPW